PPDVQVLKNAASRLAVTEAAQTVTVAGRVHLLTKKEAGGPGIIGIEALGQGRGPKRYRAHLLSPEDYHLAVRAHDEDLVGNIMGDLERDGNMLWLYRARLLETLGTVEQFSSNLRTGQGREEMPGQLRLEGIEVEVRGLEPAAEETPGDANQHS